MQYAFQEGKEEARDLVLKFALHFYKAQSQEGNLEAADENEPNLQNGKKDSPCWMSCTFLKS